MAFQMRVGFQTVARDQHHGAGPLGQCNGLGRQGGTARTKDQHFFLEPINTGAFSGMAQPEKIGVMADALAIGGLHDGIHAPDGLCFGGKGVAVRHDRALVGDGDIEATNPGLCEKISQPLRRNFDQPIIRAAEGLMHRHRITVFQALAEQAIHWRCAHGVFPSSNRSSNTSAVTASTTGTARCAMHGS